MDCGEELSKLEFSEAQVNLKYTYMVGEDLKCMNFKSGKSFYKALRSDTEFMRVTLRSFYGVSGETARLFFPELASLMPNTEQLVSGVVDEIVDEYTAENGNYVEVTYIFNKPVNNIVVYTDSNQFKDEYSFSSRGSSAIFIGNAVIPFDFTNNYQIQYNAVGPIELIIEK